MEVYWLDSHQRFLLLLAHFVQRGELQPHTNPRKRVVQTQGTKKANLNRNKTIIAIKEGIND